MYLHLKSPHKLILVMQLSNAKHLLRTAEQNNGSFGHLARTVILILASIPELCDLISHL